MLVKWYNLTRWILEKVDSFPDNQRFVFGTRLADHTIGVLETLVEASYSSTKATLLSNEHETTNETTDSVQRHALAWTST